MPHKRLRLLVSGRVQGVGYRWFVRRTALDLGLSGWVRNEPDGSVSAQAQGAEPALERLVGELKDGCCTARINSITASPEPLLKNEDGFRIKA